MRIVVGLIFLMTGPRWVQAAPFTSIHVFGDGVCTTNGNSSTGLPYHETGGSQRFCNGRVWIEVLATWQGLPYIEAHNNSYFGHDSEDLVDNVNAFAAPADIATALVIVWANDADLVGFLNSGVSPPPYDASDLVLWTNFINEAVASHEAAIGALHAKGVRTLVLPEAVDVGKVPLYAFFDPASKAFIRQRVIEFNAALDDAVTGLRSRFPDLVIHQPAAFAFFDDIIANPADYGLTIAELDAISDLGASTALDGPGADYVFWDNVHPSAKVQMFLADLVQQELCPLSLTGVSLDDGNTLLTIRNIPLGRSGVVEGRDGPGPWQQDASIFEALATGNSTATVTFPTPSPTRLQRVRFPVTWSWP
jgi:hypothetical protein